MSFHNVCWQAGTGERASVHYSLIVHISESERNQNYFKKENYSVTIFSTHVHSVSQAVISKIGE